MIDHWESSLGCCLDGIAKMTFNHHLEIRRWFDVIITFRGSGNKHSGLRSVEEEFLALFIRESSKIFYRSEPMNMIASYNFHD